MENLNKQLEELARQAKYANSFRDYVAGSATAELNEYITKAEEIAAEAVKRLEQQKAPQDRADKVAYLLERYKVKILEWLIDYYRCEAACPSIMISGGSNFPVRKKEKQNARREAIQENSPEYILNQIKSMQYNAGTIYSDDENAVERLKAKIESEERAHEHAKKGNAYYAKNGTLKGFEGITDEEAAKIESRKYWQGWQPFSTLNNTAEIRRLKERLLKLSPEEVKADKVITINGKQATYENIIALFDNAKPHKSRYGGEEFYFSIPLVFSDGSRKYQEYFGEQADESGENIHRYGNAKNGFKSYFVPFTDKLKFNAIISKISGSGNKAVIYSILKDLLPKEEKEQAAAIEQAKEAAATINGESVTIERNTELVRLQILFDGIPQAETREKMKSNGFKWSPNNKAWQRLLNDNAEYALKRLLDTAQ